MRFSVSVSALLCTVIGIASPVSIAAPPAEILSQLQLLAPDRTPDAVIETPFKGLYEVRFGSALLYLSADGRYLIEGSLIDLEQRKNITQESERQIRTALLAEMEESEMVIYEPEQTKRTLTIFTDIDCPYCIRLHAERETLLAAGVRLRYLFYPRAGLDSSSYRKAVDVWCADDRATALTVAKEGMGLESRECDTPILSHIRYAGLFGLKGTPHIVIDNGEVIGGYMPAVQLLQRLGLRPKG